MTKTITQRRICWPNPDATCLQGGCSHCNGHPFRSIKLIREYAKTAGTLPHRASGEQDALEAFEGGRSAQFWNVDTR